jgi:hypothetical protein
MNTLTFSQLVAMLASIPGTAFVGLLTLTDTRCRKTGNPFGTVLKACLSSAQTGASYEAGVNREGYRQGQDAQFTAGALPKGRKWLVVGKVLESDTEVGKYYLRTQIAPGQRKVKSARVLAYVTTQGQQLTREQVAPFLPPKAESAKQQASGLEATVWVRDYLFTSIQKIRIAGRTYRVVPDVK